MEVLEGRTPMLNVMVAHVSKQRMLLADVDIAWPHGRA